MRYQDIIEGIKPAYGYWVTPEGTIIPVPRDHDNTSREHGLGVKEALEAGWIRIVAGDSYRRGEFGVDFVNGLQTRQAISGVRKLAKDIEPTIFSIHHHGKAGLMTYDLIAPFLRGVADKTLDFEITI